MYVNATLMVVDMTDETLSLKPSDLAGARIREIRGRRGWTARQLADRCADAGAPELTASVIANIETGRRDTEGRRRRDVTIDELMALAYVLEVPPVSLLVPAEGGQIEITSKVEMGVAVALGFFSGRMPAPDAEQRAGWIDIAHNALLHRVTSLDDEDLSQRPAEVRAQLVENVDAAFLEVREVVPRGRNGGGPAREPVVVAIVTSDRGVLLGRRNDGKPPWTFIAGEQEPGERVEDTAIREVKEETTLRVRTGDVIGQRVHPKTGRTMIYLAASPTHGTDAYVGDEEELAEVRWVSLAEANELMQPYGMFEPVREYLARELGAGEQES